MPGPLVAQRGADTKETIMSEGRFTHNQLRDRIRKWDRPIADINIWQDYKNDIKTALQWVMRRR